MTLFKELFRLCAIGQTGLDLFNTIQTLDKNKK
jgi:hypothetical protein